MKKLVLLIAILAYASLTFAQNEIPGTWLSENEDAKIEMYKSGNKYFGKIFWLAERHDENLELKGYLGFLSDTEEWTRTTK